jgi:hypothetical protein
MSSHLESNAWQPSSNHFLLDFHEDTLNPLENRPGDGGVTQRIVIHSDRGLLPTSLRDQIFAPERSGWLIRVTPGGYLVLRPLFCLYLIHENSI